MAQENEIENGDAAFDEAELMLPPVPQIFLLDSAVQSARERWWTTPTFGKLSVRACRRPWSLFQTYSEASKKQKGSKKIKKSLGRSGLGYTVFTRSTEICRTWKAEPHRCLIASRLQP